MKRVRKGARVLWDAVNRFNLNDGAAMAGFIAFTLLLSIFPFLIFATTLIGILVGPTRTDEIVTALFQIVPEHVALTLEPVVDEVLNKQSSGILTISAVFAVYVASNAVEAFRTALDRAYRVAHPRSFLIGRFVSLVFVLLGAVVTALLGFSILLSPLLIRFAQNVAGIAIPNSAALLSYGFGLLVFTGFVMAMHRYLPGRRLHISRLWPGVVLTTLLWLIAATGFSIYLGFSPTYTVTYGALAGVIITLMFFYLTGATIIFGAELNAAITQAERKADIEHAADLGKAAGHGDRT